MISLYLAKVLKTVLLLCCCMYIMCFCNHLHRSTSVNGILYFKSYSRNSTKDDPWRIVVRNMEEKEKLAIHVVQVR